MMMNRKFRELFEKDTRARWFVLAVSIIGTALAGFSSDVAGYSLGASELIAFGVGCAIFFLLLGFCLAGPDQKEKRRRSERKSLRFNQILAPVFVLALTIVSLLLLSLETPALRSFVLDQRLRTVLAARDIESSARDTRLILAAAKEDKVGLSPDLLVVAAARTQNTAGNWEAISDAIDVKFGPKGSGSLDAYKPLVVLDDKTYADTIVKGQKVIYSGEPVVLRNVHFENSSFEIQDSDNGRRLAEALLISRDGSVSVTLH